MSFTTKMGISGEPSQDNTIVLPDASGTVYVSGGTDIAIADGGTGASTLAGAGLPVVVASFAAKGLTGALATQTILASAPAGRYRASILYNVPSASAYDVNATAFIEIATGQISTLLSASSRVGGTPTDGFNGVDVSPPQDGGLAEFILPGTDDIGVSVGWNAGTDALDVYVLLERLPDAPSTAALYYLNAVPEAGGTITLDPVGPTFAAGTVVSMSASATASGVSFGAWTGDSTATANPINVTMSAAKSYGCTFI